DLTESDGMGTMRVVAVKNRLFIFLAGGEIKNGKPTMPKADIDRFLRSIKITYKGGDVVAGGPGTVPQPGPGGLPLPPGPSPIGGWPRPGPPPQPGPPPRSCPRPPPGPGPGPLPGPGPGDPTGGGGDGNMKTKIDEFFAAAFDADKKEVYTFEARPVGTRTLGTLRRYSYPDFKPLNKYKIPQLGFRAVID